MRKLILFLFIISSFISCGDFNEEDDLTSNSFNPNDFEVQEIDGVKTYFKKVDEVNSNGKSCHVLTKTNFLGIAKNVKSSCLEGDDMSNTKCQAQHLAELIGFFIDDIDVVFSNNPCPTNADELLVKSNNDDESISFGVCNNGTFTTRYYTFKSNELSEESCEKPRTNFDEEGTKIVDRVWISD